MFKGEERPNKDRMARTVAEHLPALAVSVPPIRKLWMSEDQRMAIFDAVSFALTYYYSADGNHSLPIRHPASRR